MKSPDEIKKGLECCAMEYDKDGCDKCPYVKGPKCREKNADALALIQQLQHNNAQLAIDKAKLAAENAEQADRIKQLEAENAQLLEKVDRFSKVAFEQNMVILGKQGIITKQERRRANYESEIWQLKQQVPRWISVEERLPECDKTVLGYTDRDGGQCEMVYYSTRVMAWCKNGGLLIPKVTHWMPMPEPPKEPEA